MKQTTVAMLAIAAVGILMWQYRTGQAQSAAQLPIAVGIVDVPKVLTECKANLEREAEGQQRSEDMQSQLKTLEDELDRMKRELEEVLKPGTDEYDALLEKWYQKNLWRESFRKYQSERLQNETVLWLQGLYNQMIEEARLLAVQKGLALVLEKDAIKEEPSQLSDMYRMIGNRKLIYHTPALDITGEVIERMDLTYNKQNP